MSSLLRTRIYHSSNKPKEISLRRGNIYTAKELLAEAENIVLKNATTLNLQPITKNRMYSTLKPPRCPTTGWSATARAGPTAAARRAATRKTVKVVLLLLLLRSRGRIPPGHSSWVATGTSTAGKPATATATAAAHRRTVDGPSHALALLLLLLLLKSFGGIEVRGGSIGGLRGAPGRLLLGRRRRGIPSAGR